MYEVCEDAVADGVRYLEVRFSPILHTKEGMSLSQVMEAICEGQLMAEHNLPILYAAAPPPPSFLLPLQPG
jgi:adenosine deaminase